jgi:very-short-patch-repair endonuclease
MQTAVFKDREPSDLGASGARQTLARLLQSPTLHPHLFVRHASIGPFVVEHVCRERGVIVEVHRGETVAGQRLKSRLQFLQSLGFKVVLIKRNDILKHPEVVLEKVRSALE